MYMYMYIYIYIHTHTIYIRIQQNIGMRIKFFITKEVLIEDSFHNLVSGIKKRPTHCKLCLIYQY